MRVCRFGLVSGRVQGVSFRQHVSNAAGSVGVTGWARNMDDGRVEVLLCGDAEAVNRVVEAVHQGPALARVEGVQWQERAFERHHGFQIGWST